MRADIDAEAEGFPDLLARSAEILRYLFSETLDVVPEWARPLELRRLFRHPPSTVPGSAC